MMGLRLSFGIGPLRASIPLTRRRRRRPRGRTYHGITRLPDGTTHKCHHAHRTREAAIACASKYGGTQAPATVRKPPQWWPRAGWGTIRNYQQARTEDGHTQVSFTFVPDDGTEPRHMNLTDPDQTVLEAMGEYARAIIDGRDITIKVPAKSMADVERDTFARINRLRLPDRKKMFANSSDVHADCGWTWTPDYKLVKAAPGLFN